MSSNAGYSEVAKLNLSPANLEIFALLTAKILTLGARMPIGMTDSFILYMIALYLSRDSEAKIAFENRLEDFGDFVPEVWRRLYAHVMHDNSQGLEASTLDVEQLLRRLRDGDYGQSLGGKS